MGNKSNRTSAKSNFGKRGWMLVLFMFLGYFVTTAVPSTLPNVFNLYFNQLGWSNVAIQSCLSAGRFCSVILILIVGQVLMKFSVRKMGIILLSLWIICTVIIGIQTAFIGFAILVILMNLIGDTVGQTVNSTLAANWFPKKRGLVMGWATFGFPLAAGVGMIIMKRSYALAGTMFGGIAPIIVIAIITLGILIFVLRDYPEECNCHPDNDPNAKREDISKFQSMPTIWTNKRVLTTPETYLVALSLGTMMFCAGFMTQVAPALFSMGFNQQMISPVMLCIAACACIGSYICGVIDTKIGTKNAILITDGVLLAMGLLMQLNNKVTTFMGFACMAVVMGGGSNYLVSMVSSLWGRHHFRSINRWTAPFMQIITSFSSVTIAAIAAATSFRIAYLLAAGMSAIGAILILCVKKERVDKREMQYIQEDGVSTATAPFVTRPDTSGKE